MTIAERVSTLSNGTGRTQPDSNVQNESEEISMEDLKDLEVDDYVPVRISVDGDESLLGGEQEVSQRTWVERLMLMGPGIMVCLADTDGPCLITAAQSGAQFGYSLLLAQIVLIPILFMAQELTVRLGLFAQKGLTEIIRERYGTTAGYFFCGYVAVICIGAMISEIVCIAQAGFLLGMDFYLSCCLTVVLLSLIVVCGGYKTVEKIGVALGCCQLVFLPLIFLTGPDWGTVWSSLWNYGDIFSSDDPDSGWKQFLMMLCANIGAVIMPWMLFYQQSAIVVKKELKRTDLNVARADTAVGSTLTQIIMSALVMAIAAAAINKPGSASSITNVKDILDRFAPYLGGQAAATWIICIGMFGASLVAALVVSLCAAWCAAEALNKPRSLDLKVTDAPHFYIGYFIVLVLGCIVAMVLGPGDAAVKFNIGIQILNCLTMPLIIVLLVFFANSSQLLPEEIRLKGWYLWFCVIIFAIISLFSYVSIPFMTLPTAKADEAFQSIEGNSVFSRRSLPIVFQPGLN